MTTATQRPQPMHRSDAPGLKSRALGKFITTNSIPHLSIDDLEALRDELEPAIASLKMRMSSQRWPVAEYQSMNAQRAAWGALHQVLARRIKKLRPPHIEAIATGATDVSWYFQQVARQELDACTYQRLVLQAEIRCAGAKRGGE